MTVETQSPTAENAPQESAPQPFLAGTFALYDKPDGGVHAVMQTQDGAVHHKTFPASIVSMFRGGEDDGGWMGKVARKIFGDIPLGDKNGG